MRGVITSLKALAIMSLAGFGVSMVHWNAAERSGSLGVGAGVFLLAGAWLLYRSWFSRTYPSK
jgi:hypothetical protein